MEFSFKPDVVIFDALEGPAEGLSFADELGSALRSGVALLSGVDIMARLAELDACSLAPIASFVAGLRGTLLGFCGTGDESELLTS